MNDKIKMLAQSVETQYRSTAEHLGVIRVQIRRNPDLAIELLDVLIETNQIAADAMREISKEGNDDATL